MVTAASAHAHLLTLAASPPITVHVSSTTQSLLEHVCYGEHTFDGSRMEEWMSGSRLGILMSNLATCRVSLHADDLLRLRELSVIVSD